MHFKIYLLIDISSFYHTALCCCSAAQSFRLFTTPWTAACQASLSFTIFQSLLKLMSIDLVMPSNHLILCLPILLLPSIFPSLRVFSNVLALCIRWPKYWSFRPGTLTSETLYYAMVLLQNGSLTNQPVK